MRGWLLLLGRDELQTPGNLTLIEADVRRVLVKRLHTQASRNLIMSEDDYQIDRSSIRNSAWNTIFLTFSHVSVAAIES